MSTILSIQSHVAYGYVGNRVATFALQRLGNEVLTINTVQFSNHTGYGKWEGDIFDQDHIKRVVKGLEAQKVLTKCNAIVSGYIGSPNIGNAILEAVALLKQKNPQAIYCCDPVMGDMDRGFFAQKGVFEFFKEQAIQHADVITPNQFEACALAEHDISTLDDAKFVATKLKEMGPKIVVITSLRHKDTANNEIETLLYDGKEFLICKNPLIQFTTMPSGSGDMFTALFSHHYLSTKDLSTSLCQTVASLYDVLLYSFKAKSYELKLIEAQDFICNPKSNFQVIQV